MKILSRYTKYTDAHEMDLSGWAKRNFGVPLIIENDARAALIGEWQYGAGMNCNDLVLITLGTGVGSAVILNGKLLKGKHFFAGNLGGHMTINFDGNTCNCGNIGCLDSEASTWALAQKFDTGSSLTGPKNFPPKLDFEYIFASAKSGDALARGIRDECLKAWSLSVINLIHAYNPEKVVIGGGIMKSKDEILPFIREMVTKHSWCKNGDIKIVSAGQIEYAGILGMAYLVKALKNNR
jgi:glucokinase